MRIRGRGGSQTTWPVRRVAVLSHLRAPARRPGRAWRLLAGLLLLGGASGADEVADAADRVAGIFRARGDLRELASKDDPDPWLVADELCARGEHDAAEAFAKAAPRRDTEKLPGNVAAQRASPTDPALRKALETASAALDRGSFEEALSAVAAATIRGKSVTAARLLSGRGLALQSLGRWDDAAQAFLSCADMAEELGWLARATLTLDLAGASCWMSSDHRGALAALERRLGLEERRANRVGWADTLARIGLAHSILGDQGKALESQRRVLAAMEALGDRAGIARALGSIGRIHRSLAAYAESLDCLQQALVILEEIGDRAGVASTLTDLGNTHGSLGDHAKALDCHERALAILEELGDRVGAAAALVNVGIVHHALGDYGKDLECQERALAVLEEAHDRPGVATTLGNIGNAHHAMGDQPKALDYQERALAMHEALGDRAGVARTLGNIGAIHCALGEHAKALDFLERALAVWEALRDPAGAAATLGNIGVTHEALGDYARALACQERALALMGERGNRAGVAAALGNIGRIHRSLGDYARALGFQERALSMKQELGERAGVAAELLNIGDIRFRLGDHERALACLEQALALTEETGDRATGATALGAIGVMHEALGDHATALAFQERALAAMERLGNRAGVARALGNIGNLHRALGDRARALDCQERALVAKQALGDRAGTAVTLHNIGLIRWDLGDTGGALDLLVRSLALTRELGATDMECRVLWSLAGVRLARKEPRDAAAVARQAIERMRHCMSGLADEQGTVAREQFSEAFETGVRAGLALGEPAEVSFFLESGRAGLLLEGLALKDRLGAVVLPEDLRAAEVAARDRERALLWHHRRAVERGERVADLAKQLEAARAGVVEAIHKIQREAKAQAALVYPKADSLEEIRSALRAGEALVLYALMEGESVALVVTPGDARIAPLGGTDEIAAAAEALRRAVARPDGSGASSGDLARRLSRLVLEPLGLGEGVRRLLVSPDGPLSYLPFAVLCDADVAYVPSGTTYRLLREEEEKRGAKVLALGDPAYDAARRLPASRAEARSVGDVVLLGEDATVPALREAVATRERWRAVHLACHGRVDPERPVLSALELTPQGEDDGFLKCLDVYRMRIPADLVVLSACETAQGRVFRTEGVMGWTRAFMFAGAPRVLVSLWKVDDAATRALMERFYELWKDGKVPAATALRQAQAHVASQEKWNHPYFWAAWQLWGLAQ